MAKPARVLSWYRIAQGPLGLTATLVESAGLDDDAVLFLRASSEDEALRLARNAHERSRMQRNRAAWRAAGRCIRCGRERDVEGRLSCSFCLERQSGENYRARRRRNGEAVPVPSRAEGLERRRLADQAALELELLEKVDDIWTRRGTVGLRQWLGKELAARRARRVA